MCRPAAARPIGLPCATVNRAFLAAAPMFRPCLGKSSAFRRLPRPQANPARQCRNHASARSCGSCQADPVTARGTRSPPCGNRPTGPRFRPRPRRPRQPAGPREHPVSPPRFEGLGLRSFRRLPAEARQRHSGHGGLGLAPDRVHAGLLPGRGGDEHHTIEDTARSAPGGISTGKQIIHALLRLPCHRAQTLHSGTRTPARGRRLSGRAARRRAEIPGNSALGVQLLEAGAGRPCVLHSGRRSLQLPHRMLHAQHCVAPRALP